MRYSADEAQSKSQSVARALSILLWMSSGTSKRGIREIAREFKLAPSIVQRLMLTLGEFGFVEQDVNRKYQIGVNAFRVGKSYLASNSFLEVSLPDLRNLTDNHGYNMFLGVLQGDRVVYLAALSSNGPIAIRSVPGSAAYLHSTAFGKVFLADMAPADAKALLGPEPYGKLASKTRTTWRALAPELRQVREQGYSVADAENLENVFAAGALVRGPLGEAVAAISAALPRSGLNAAARKSCCALVSAAARNISRKLGVPEEFSIAGSSQRRPHESRATNP